MNRSRVRSKRGDKRYFRATAIKTKKANLISGKALPRGGVRL